MTTAAELRNQYGNFGEHPDRPIEDWKCQVSNDDTRQGYWDWLAGELEAENGLASAGWVPNL